jgi:hypothetical protein
MESQEEEFKKTGFARVKKGDLVFRFHDRAPQYWQNSSKEKLLAQYEEFEEKYDKLLNLNPNLNKVN